MPMESSVYSKPRRVIDRTRNDITRGIVLQTRIQEAGDYAERRQTILLTFWQCFEFSAETKL